MNRPMIEHPVNPYVTETVDAEIQLSGLRVDIRTIRSTSAFSHSAASPSPQLTCVTYNGVPAIPTKVSFGDGSGATHLSNMGDLVFRPSNIPINIIVSEQEHVSSRLVMCDFDVDFFLENSNIRNWSRDHLTRCGSLVSRSITAMVQQIATEVTEPGFGASIAIESMARLTLVELSRLFGTFSEESRSSMRLAPWQLKRIDEYLRDAKNAWPTVSQLADLCGISARHLSRVFPATMGVSLSEYSEQVRVRRAKELLVNSNLTLKQIAAVLGFSNPNSFSVAFRRATGETPKVYYRRSRKTLATESF